MLEIIGIVASVLGILAFFAVAPEDLKANLKSWFVQPVSNLTRHQNKLDIKELFDLLGVDDIRAENVFVSRPLKSDSFDAEVREYDNKLPDAIETLKQQEISGREKLAREDGKTFDNNASYALRRIDISRPEGPDGKRKNVYKLILEPTDYYSFIFPNLCLDKSYYNEATQENHTLRDMLAIDRRRLSISTLPDFPTCQFKVGTGTLLVTKDGYLVCSVRSGSQFIASKQNKDEMAVHLSAAEGMYRSENNPASSDIDTEGRPSPFVTCARSLEDELNLSAEHFEANSICCLGYFFDLKRAQPFFLFYLEIDLSVDQFFSNYSNTSTDIHENEAIFALPKNFDSVKKLFSGCTFGELDASYPVMYEDFFKGNSAAKVRIASNHAKAGFATYVFRELGPITRSMI